MDGEIFVKAGAQNGICVCPHGLGGVRIGEDSEQGLSVAAEVLEDAERVADLDEGGVQRSGVGGRVGLKRLYNLQQRRVGARQEEAINETQAVLLELCRELRAGQVTGGAVLKGLHVRPQIGERWRGLLFETGLDAMAVARMVDEGRGWGGAGQNNLVVVILPAGPGLPLVEKPDLGTVRRLLGTPLCRLDTVEPFRKLTKVDQQLSVGHPRGLPPLGARKCGRAMYPNPGCTWESRTAETRPTPRSRRDLQGLRPRCDGTGESHSGRKPSFWRPGI